MHICHITINPIDYERRIKNQAESATRKGFTIWILALGKKGEQSHKKLKEFDLWRINTPFYKGGPLKFIHFNLQVVFFLLRISPDMIHCHDLWVLPAAALVSIIKKVQLVYDAHEYYTGLEIFNNRKFRKKLWMLIERISISRVSALITVSEPLARLYEQRYPAVGKVSVIRNLPKFESASDSSHIYNLPSTGQKTVLFQGHFRPGRGLKSLIESMADLNDIHLVLIGGGELEAELKHRIEELGIGNRISFMGYVPTEFLIKTTSQADLGIALFEPTSVNYAYALPNKFFEYIMAGIPVLASDIETFRHYMKEYDIGMTVNPTDIQAITRSILTMLNDENALKRWKENARKASKILNWENEAKKLIKIYEEL